MQLEQKIREQVLDIVMACKDNYLIVYNYIETNRGNIRVACQKYNALLQSVLQASQLADYHYWFIDPEEIEFKKITYRPRKVKKIKKQLKNGLTELHIAIQELLNLIGTEGGCFTFYVLNDAELQLIDYVERERQRQEAERVDTLLKGKPCEELIEFLKEKGTKTEYIDKSTSLKTFYYTYGSRHYDPDGSFIGYAKIIKRGMDLK